MTDLVIITVFSILGLFHSLRSKGIFQKIITLGLFISILIAWTGDKYFITYSILIQLCFAFISLIYGLIVKGLKPLERLAISTIGLILTIGTLTVIMHWPGQGILRILLLYNTPQN